VLLLAQHTTPVAIMTSAAKGNHQRVAALLERAGWFGRGRDSFRRAPPGLQALLRRTLLAPHKCSFCRSLNEACESNDNSVCMLFLQQQVIHLETLAIV
jgi:hypothetical protein